MTQPDTDSPTAAGAKPASLPPILHAGKDGPQRIRAGHKRWNEEAEATFLDHLAASCETGDPGRWSAAHPPFQPVRMRGAGCFAPSFPR